jgi:DNA-binding LytR/AlgR family response regulator
MTTSTAERGPRAASPTAIVATPPSPAQKAKPRATPPAPPPATLMATQLITPPGRFLTYFFIRQPSRWVKICIQDINYVEARKNYCKIVTRNGSHLTIVTLKRMAEILPSAEFCQIHRAFIVAVDWVSSFDNTSVYGPDQMLPIGENYRQALKNRFPLIGELARRQKCLPHVPVL